jgi:starch phosphorylase
MNGALTIGTLDGANIEIRDAVGHDNFFLFGATAEEIPESRARGYSPRAAYESNAELREALDLIGSSDAYSNTSSWTNKSILNCARAGHFSSARSIRQYCRDIWDIRPRF